MNQTQPQETSFKENRIRDILFIYYSRADVKKALFDFSKNRECIPRYFEGFGKRPDTFQYESDITEQVRRGATSFHCSEEIWEDPLEIVTNMSPQDSNELRSGWDLLIDIDSPYLEYSKIYSDLLIKTLEFHGIKNIGVKFSGSKGMHIIVPWTAFPKEVYGKKTSDMFPEWPRLICQYLTEIIQPKLIDKIYGDKDLDEIAKKSGREKVDMLVMECNTCNSPAEIKELITWICPICKNELTTIKKNKRIPKCPDDKCRHSLEIVTSKEIYNCIYCNINSFKNPLNFGESSNSFIPTEKKALERKRVTVEKDIEADLILVAPRHLFRMPYSLHEKTALASIVIDKHKILDFQIPDAKPLKVQVKEYYPNAEPEEARELLLQALDYKEQKDKEKAIADELNKNQNQSDQNPSYPNSKNQNKNYKQIIIQNPTSDIYPPCILKLLKGIKDDGRKRALFIIINFFKSLGTDETVLEQKIHDWNEKNNIPLKEGYIRSQLLWYRKKGMILPPNCDKPNYKDLTVCNPDTLCKTIKNPLNYAMKKHYRSGNK